MPPRPLACATQHRQGQLPFRLIADLFRNARLLQPLGVVGPRLRKVEPGIESDDFTRRRQLQRHGDLAARDLAERPRVLPRHADGMRSLLGEACVIEDQKTIPAEPATDPGLQTVEHRLLVPGALVDKLLDRLLIVFRTRLDLLQAGCHRLNALASAV